MATAVGIELGTTDSVIATVEASQPKVIPNAEGSRTKPSIVGYTLEGERLVGQLARRHPILNPKGVPTRPSGSLGVGTTKSPAR